MLSRLKQAGVTSSAATEVVPLQPPTIRRAVFYLSLGDGREIKVRLVPRPQGCDNEWNGGFRVWIPGSFRN